jgi:NADH oxidase (H2O-forming)
MLKGKTVEITKDITWIGITDPMLRTFDIIMETKFGTTYNSFFINAEKKTIIETAKETFKDEYLDKLRSVVNPEEIEYIILDHTEPDHSGCLKHLLPLAKNATVVGSGNALRYLQDIVGFSFKSLQVKDGDTLNLGNKTIRFISAPNLHWPDTIFSYLEEDKILFSCDAFGAHYCPDHIFDDETDNFDEAFKYYFDVIMKPFSKFMLKGIDKIKDLEINMICPGHGPLLRRNWKKYVDLSAELATQHLDVIKYDHHQVFIAFVSAYGYTKDMADKIAQGIRSVGNFNVIVSDIEAMDHFTIENHIIKSSAVIIGSPTINQNILPQIYALFAAISPIRDKGKLAASFGSYGWSGEGVTIMDSMLSTLKLNVVLPGLKIRFAANEEICSSLFEFGRVFGLKLAEIKPVAD